MRILNISVNPIDSIDIRGIEQLKKLTKDPKYDFKFKLGKLWKKAPILVEKIEIKYV